MTISRQDVEARSSGPEVAGLPIPADQAERVAAVLNSSTTHRPAVPTTRVPPTEHPRAPAAVPAPRTGTRLPRQQVLDVMRRAGYPPAQIEVAGGLLPDDVDSHRDRHLLARFALTSGQLMDHMGASP